MTHVFSKKKISIGIMLFLLVQIVLPNLSNLSIYSKAASVPKLTFTNSGIEETVQGSGYSITTDTGAQTGNNMYVLTISSSGTYIITGTCTNGSINIKKDVSDVDILIEDLTLTCTDSAPIVVKKSESATTSARIFIEGENTLTDNEDINNETSEDTTIADAFEGAAIKVKTGSNLTLTGNGTLNVDATNCKNGIKGGTNAVININNGIYNIDASNNGIACDNILNINGGTIDVTSGNDGIKSEPDSTDTTSSGIINIEDGDITVNATSDGITAANELNINGGTFNIKTLDGYNSSSFNSDTMSCKGLKASTDESEDVKSTINISGGTFELNCADDAIHSDAYVEITGGDFEIYTGDDGAHADTSLILGSESGYGRDPSIKINKSYEGLEGGTVYIYSGRYYVISSDDGINAAGGSSSGSDPGSGGGGGDHFNPGGGRPRSINTTASEYGIYVYGGNIYVNVDGDGIDANGDISFYGGTTEVWGMKSGGDNEPIDLDGSLIINDATVFAAGGKGMTYTHSAITSTNQSYKTSTSTTFTNGNTVYVKNASSSVEYYGKATKQVNYVFYTSPKTTSSYTITSSGSATCKYSNSWGHTFNDGEVITEATSKADGVKRYTCSVCGHTEDETLHYHESINDEIDLENGGSDSGDSGDGGDTDTQSYKASFSWDSNIEGVEIYYTQDYTTASETFSSASEAAAYARDGSTGDIDATGSGQINFKILLADGYEIDTVNIEGSYKNLKGPEDTSVDNTYRITKVASDLTITITSKATEESDSGETSEETNPIYRLYNKTTGEHLFTSKETEYNKLETIGWVQEGKSFDSVDSTDSDATPVYRLFNANGFDGLGDHHYTKSTGEMNKLIQSGWKVDFSGSPAFYVKGSITVYKLYNKNTGAHHYTPKTGESNNMQKAGWKLEGVAWYVNGYYSSDGTRTTE